MSSLAQRLLAEATELSFPRYPGSDGDARIIELLAERIRDAGLSVSIEEFSYDLGPAVRALRTVLVFGALLIAAVGAAGVRWPVWSLVVLAASILPAGLLLGWSPWLERLYRGDGPTRTANVVGRRAVDRPRLRLIVMAHHDSKSQSLSLPYRTSLTVLAVGGVVVLLATTAAAALRQPLPGPWWVPPAGGLVAAASLLALSTIRSGNRSPGAVDNAGSLAILLALARALPGELPDDVELVVLSTGAEEDHMVGAMRWLDAHVPSRDPIACLNLDGVGAPGRVVLIERYGFGRRFSAELSAAARRAASQIGIRVRGILMPPAIGIDAIPFAHRGIDCLTLSSGSLGRATMSVHSAHDRPEHLDGATLAQVYRLTSETIRQFTATVD